MYNPNGGEELKLFTVFRENGWELPFSQLTLFISITIRSSILYMRAISGYFAVLAQNFFLKVWIHWQNHSFETNSTSEVFKYPLTKTPCSFKCFLSSATFIALKSLYSFFCHFEAKSISRSYTCCGNVPCLHHMSRDTRREI